MKLSTKKMGMAAAILGSMAMAACMDEASVANDNLTKAAGNFELLRTVTFYNTQMDENILQITGFCSVNDLGHKFLTVCKNPDGTYYRSQMGRNHDMSYYLHQHEGARVSGFHPRIMFRPQTMIPDIDFSADSQELLTHSPGAPVR